MRKLACAMALFGAVALADQEIRLEGEVPEDGERYFDLPFTVPDGTAEIEVRHDDLSSSNILDWGLEDPDGFRGWGGGNEEPAIVGPNAASRSYLPGPIRPGEWRVIVGKAKIHSRPARYRVDITLRTAPTLPPQPERRPYRAVAPLESSARWYAGDFHVHSLESGDARPSIDELATFARARGLDFVLLSDHNTVSQLQFYEDAQARHPELLLLPGMEYTTYRGHANAIGSTEFVDSRIGYQGRTLEDAFAAFAEQGALMSINHPVMDLPMEMCIGCAWEHPVPASTEAVEIATSGWNALGVFFTEPAIAFWDSLSARGLHVKALGGSDDHRAGVHLNDTQSPIGDPTTLVYAQELSVAGILAGIREGRTVVKLQGPGDPMIELEAPGRVGDTVIGPEAHFTARVTGGAGHAVRFVRNGAPEPAVAIPSDDFTVSHHAAARDTADRWRAEVLVGGRVRTLTSNIWVQRTADAAPSPHELSAPAAGLGCVVAPAGLFSISVLALLALASRRRR